MRHKDESGRLAPATIWSPDKAEEMVAKVNAIFTPQVNIRFSMSDAQWITVEPRLHQPIEEDVFKRFIVKHKSKTADVTLFFVGKWKGKGSHPNGSYIREEKAVAMHDNPVHVDENPGDPVARTMAHELAHFVQHTRDLVGHHDRENVLLSIGIQSTKMDKQLVADLNPW